MEINKGIGRNVEFKGLESQYLFIFCGGLLAVFVVFVILYMAGLLPPYPHKKTAALKWFIPKPPLSFLLGVQQHCRHPAFLYAVSLVAGE